ncbi:SKP1-like protein 21 isoform X1 [Zingiber officinale]|uniref:SKP1 component dimerisation domain-containing protein n=1 Tax=Zingiber officinale TaxID=94328 RepID=A0A8J5M9Z0_ZINOF|nr:SKP1-like protein 21 isoform X1 [Zingiber officinale]XP_042453532.1 SKP1-like protein 21 isoform X1 [Zingiber officinale]XP_042453533.1 SKP1-like protein 21 isoform X1 [Zingiber officinale]XP_042453534.1 SKP1-like protein 21 isoform X1 [Zingiber officinale]XP_042453535.1 SKP1-like protein 21 isoform X1 [Zingiber officinale]KAG6538050.1 hypothetical protein ZIOFF_003153 [Zingiber officinale]
MSSNRSALLAKEAKTSYIWIQIKNGLIQQVEEEFSAACPMIHREMSGTGKGSSKNTPIHLPEEVSPAMLSLILQYWKFHLIPGHSDKERRSFDEKFVKTNTDDLLELALAAHALQLRPLVDLTSGALARRIGGCSNDEIRKIFHVPDDLTEEEKLKHLKNPTNDPFIRLLNQSLARKRKKWKEQNELKNIDLLNKQEDTRPIEDLLEFINGKDKGTCKSKKENRRRKNQAHNSSVNDLDMTDRQDSTTIPSNDDSYSEGYSDQEKMRENDRIVADFARKLNVVDYY